MNIFEKQEGNMPFVEVVGADRFDIGRTFDCGQCFRFEKIVCSKHECEYSGVAFGRAVSFASDGDTLRIYNSTREDFERIWRPFLSLDVDYSEIDGDILLHSRGTVMENACAYGQGIRILRQDAFEALISFIISQNNNIPRIKKIIEAICLTCGNKIDIPEEMRPHLSEVSSLCSFPDAHALEQLGEQGLYELKTGFRAKYIYDAVTKISSGELSLVDIGALDSTQECIEALCRVKGVGPKVASCIALFGMARYDAFPIDVWIKRVAEKYFSECEDFSGEMFGKYAGIAQQYLFYYERYLGGE